MAAQKRRIPELDGYRAALIFLVSWYHLWQQSWWTPRIGSVSLDFLVRSGYMHVDGMVLLSAFLLFLPWARSRRTGEALPDPAAFYRRRFARVYPSWLCVLGIALLIALGWGLYGSVAFLVKDVATHLSFTFNLFADTYLATQLGTAGWTLAVEVQLYLLFPWIAKAAVRHPVRTLSLLTLCGWGWRAWCVLSLPDYNLVVNQLPAFLDVVALGMGLALLTVRLEEARPRRPRLWAWAATLGAAAVIWLLVLLLKRQAAESTYPLIQRGQMLRRLPLCLLYGALILALPRMIRPLRCLFANRVTAWLAAISMNYYLLHAIVAVHLKRIGFPPSASAEPFRVGEMPWQWQYTFLCFGLSVGLAALLTFAVEKPAAAALARRFAAEDRRAALRAEQARNAINQEKENNHAEQHTES